MGAMTGTSEGDDYVYGYPQYPSQNQPNSPPQYIPYPHYILVPGSPPRPRSRKSCGGAICSATKASAVALFVVLFAGLGFLSYPRQPDVDVARISLEKLNFYIDGQHSILPSVHLDVTLSLLLKITNPNFFGVVYDNVSVTFSYRGDRLGKVESGGGDIPSRSVVLATATLDLQGKELLEHAAELIMDVASGTLPLETVTHFQGAVEMFFLRPQINVKVYCNLLVDPREKEVLNADCSLL